MSDGDLIAVKHAALHHAAETIRAHAKSMRGDQEMLQQEVKKVAATWEGEAATKYQQVQGNWDMEADGLTASLEKIASALDQANIDYQTTDSKAAAKFEM